MSISFSLLSPRKREERAKTTQKAKSYKLLDPKNYSV
jgi:hypothetical protein